MRQETPPTLALGPAEGDTATVVVAGDWSLHQPHPSASHILERLDAAPSPQTVVLDLSALGSYDSTLVALLVELAKRCAERKAAFNTAGCPEGVRELLKLALAVPEASTRTRPTRENFFTRVGKAGLGLSAGVFDVFSFIG